MDWIVPDTATASPLVYMLTVAFGVLLIGFSKGGFGGGVGVLAVPLFLQVLPGQTALSMILPLLIVCDAFTLRHFPRDWHPPSFWRIAGGTVIGLLIGLYLLVLFARADVDGDRWIKLIVAITALFFCALKAWRALRGERLIAFQPGALLGTAIGVLCGITTMVAHAAGLLVNMFLIAQKLDQRVFVGTCARYYLLFNSVKVPLYLLAGAAAEGNYITWQTLKWDLWLVPLCPIGVGLGAWLNRRMSGSVFTFCIYLTLGITGIKMLADTL